VTIRNREEDLSMSHNLTRRSFQNLPAVHYEDVTKIFLCYLVQNVPSRLVFWHAE